MERTSVCGFYGEVAVQVGECSGAVTLYFYRGAYNGFTFRVGYGTCYLVFVCFGLLCLFIFLFVCGEYNRLVYEFIADVRSGKQIVENGLEGFAVCYDIDRAYRVDFVVVEEELVARLLFDGLHGSFDGLHIFTECYLLCLCRPSRQHGKGPQ